MFFLFVFLNNNLKDLPIGRCWQFAHWMQHEQRQEKKNQYASLHTSNSIVLALPTLSGGQTTVRKYTIHWKPLVIFPRNYTINT